MILRYSIFTLFILFCFNVPVQARQDVFGNGTGRNGASTIMGSTGVVNIYAIVTAPVAPGDLTITFGSSTVPGAIAAGDLLMIWQATGFVPAPAVGSQAAINLSSDPVGRWEFARVASVAGSTITFTAACTNSYAANVTQIIQVPEYTNLTIPAAQGIVAMPWDGVRGGIVVLLASGTIDLNGSINASGRGNRAGVYVDDLTGNMGSTGLNEAAPSGAQKGEGIVANWYGATFTGRGNMANGAGGGVALNSGGGGGGNKGAGGKGGRTHSSDGSRGMGGLGGVSLLYSPLDHLLMGGGGAAGHGDNNAGSSGGAGGGVVFIRCNQMTGTGSLLANGALGGTSSDDGAGGGGAGGTVYLRATGNVNFGNLQATGGNGGSPGSPEHGPGGGGGGGAVLIQACNIGGSRAVNGAQSGTQSNAFAPDGIAYGAIAGAAGSITVIPGCMTIPATPNIVTPAAGGVVKNLTNISGTGPANTSIALYLNNTLLNTVTSDAAGNFTYNHPGTMADGVHTLKVYAIAQALYSSPVTVSFNTLATLPVQLLSFKAVRTNNGVALNWTTGEESNSHSFSLERSNDGRSFTALGNVPAAGFAATPTTYAYTDAHSAPGINYYRLKASISMAALPTATS
ncbi:adventurous gliding motility protein AgmC [Paraflavitalea speifideaquila]|uniref:adventurous gliding motility protein AgmC n=1 Tax=Paraflavitalea speifideaquila TaxID=3076558 RepID=UPI0028E1C995|nr:hypothetical protein [Paraflavitalea speifideiaquila]